MDVGSLCQRNVVTVRQQDELMAAADLMRKRHIGYLIVVEPEPAEGGMRPIGVLTDRDIVISVVAQQTDPRSLRVGDVMTREPQTVHDTDTVNRALESMRGIGVRRLPVVNNSGQLVGVLSLDDILESLTGLLSGVAGSIRKELRIEGIVRP